MSQLMINVTLKGQCHTSRSVIHITLEGHVHC